MAEEIKFSQCSFHSSRSTVKIWIYYLVSSNIFLPPFFMQAAKTKTQNGRRWLIIMLLFIYFFIFALRILQFSLIFSPYHSLKVVFLICNRCRQSIWSTVSTCWTMLVYLPSIVHIFTWSCSYSLWFYAAFFSVYDHDLLFWLFLSQTLLQEILKVAQTLLIIPDQLGYQNVRVGLKWTRDKDVKKIIIIIQENCKKEEMNWKHKHIWYYCATTNNSRVSLWLAHTGSP